jgi:hypothetical protein
VINKEKLMDRQLHFMKCGCTASAIRHLPGGVNIPSCPVHDCIEIVPAPDLKGRFAFCCYGNHGKAPSSLDLAFFQYQAKKEFDEYYCGCYGFD